MPLLRVYYNSEQWRCPAYICPVCFWEIDLFIQSNVEASDQNHGLTLTEARKNYQSFGAVLPMLKKSCRQPKEYEYPTK
ncbi:CPCC family cysteine-rich protein [Lysinibacillus capsici]|uniref:CPCC family cysteine-rich protein n=1 Tax=Lysinibacillus capsici TaxID=2115968 RepID=UPI001F434E6F|nr:CPCC family cysteine-rich protein [Lysinibacillus capsici]